MKTKTEEFIKLLDQAIKIAEQIRTEQQIKQPEFGHSERLNHLVNNLQSVRDKTLNGNLEPSAGVSTLGLAREVADWIEPLDSPLLKVVGAIEEYYQKYL
ncbi:hypothetical protein I8751_26360 [Nostocaceae cyanobacterium CENA357]|uniref:Uncharacterized protein n=1 Tax=Atlanticothrix silvestris CENA357 TaxID=1725252 RepID=A0A8J7HID0_9CYAN|nr:hypothetical protein [Atlanticothrix silvestris]MBH8555807.1 hypothetical protein [Atlanticothrix silvestris CENA357]